MTFRLQKPPICSSKELLSLHFLPPCFATTIETHVVAVATAVAMALGMAVAMTLVVAVAVALDMALTVAMDITVDTSLALALPAVDAGHFPTEDVIHLAARTQLKCIFSSKMIIPRLFLCQCPTITTDATGE